MCGIFGLYFQKEVSSEEVKSSNDLLENRGPDDEGYVDLESGTDFLGPDSPEELFESGLKTLEELERSSSKWFAHRRLSIQGGSLCHQPMNYNGIWMIYEGEIFNLEEVRLRLLEEGYEFSTAGDTEVMLKAIDFWGHEEIRDKIKGPYSIAIYYEERDKLIIQNDFLGRRPIYYYFEDGNFAFSSLIKPLLSLDQVDSSENAEQVIKYLKYGLVDDNKQTFFDNIQRLLPGQMIVFDGSNLELTDFKRISGTREDPVAEIKRSVRLRLRKGDSAVSLSGGKDSGVLGSHYGSDADYYHISFPKTSFDESENVKARSNQLGIDFTKIEVSRGELFYKFDELIEIIEEPVVSPTCHCYLRVCEKASSDGNLISIWGSGADELFAGYPNDIVFSMANQLRKKSFKNFYSLYKDFGDILGIENYRRLISLFLPSSLRKILFKNYKSKKWLTKDLENGFPEALEKPKSSGEKIQKSLYERKIQTVIRFSNKIVGSQSMEFRAPFLDVKLVGSAIETPFKDKLSSGTIKKPVEKASNDENLFASKEPLKKVGFIPEMDDLVGEKDLEDFEEILESKSFRSKNIFDHERLKKEFQSGEVSLWEIYRIWSYEIWHRKFIQN